MKKRKEIIQYEINKITTSKTENWRLVNLNSNNGNDCNTNAATET